jgi:hypothetical protein
MVWTVVLPGAIWIEPSELPKAITGREYAAGPLTITGGSRCTRQMTMVRVTGGELPPGVELTQGGYFRGAPLEAGKYSFIVRAANECEAIQQEYAIEVTGAPVLTVEPASVNLSVGQGSPALEDPIVVQVRSSWNGTAYTANIGDASWVRAIPVRGATPVPSSGLSADGLELHIDPSRLPPGLYRVLMKVSGWRTANTPVVPITLRVLPPDGSMAPGDVRGSLMPPGTTLPGEARDSGVRPEPAGPAAGGHDVEEREEMPRAPAVAPRVMAPKGAVPGTAPQRLSRTGPVRRRFAASTPKAGGPITPPNQKPSPVGKPIETAKSAGGHGAAGGTRQEAAKPDAHGPAKAGGATAAKPEAGKSGSPEKPAPVAASGKAAAPKHEKH